MPIVCGIHPVLEALAAGSRTIERVVVTKGVRNKRILEVIRKASERGVPLRFEPREALDRTADGERHQGVLAIVAEKGLLSLEELQKSARSPALFMLLDGVEDPRNLGAIIRSVDASGADGVILPDRHTASLSDAASRTAAGALESVKIARIGNVVQALETLKAKGFWIVGFDGSGKERWDTIDFKRPIVLVLGGEGKGIRRLVKEHCDHIVSLPVFGQVSSLNVSVAAGIALYEAVRQRGTVPTLARPIPPRALAIKKQVVIGPPPGDREEDPGALRRAAAIASLSARPEPTEVKPETEAAEAASAPLAIAIAVGALPLPSEPDQPMPIVKEASLEEIEVDDDTEAGEETQGDDADQTPVVEDGSGDAGSDEDDSLVDDDDDGDQDAEDKEGEEDEGEEDDDDDADDDPDEDDDEDDEEDQSDEEEEEEEEEDEDPGDEASDLAAPFMPEDNSGGGEVTWGSEKELHAHRPRRDGESRFNHKSGRRSGRPNDRKKKRAPQRSGASSPGNKAVPEEGRPQAQAQQPGREQSRDQSRQQRRTPDENRGPRPPKDGTNVGVPRSDERAGPEDGPAREGADSTAPQARSGDGRPDQPRDPNRPNQARRRNRRRRGGRGRNGGGDRPPGDPNAPQGPSAGGSEPREPRPAVERSPGEGARSDQSRRDRDRRRRRRGRRGNSGSGGGQGGGPTGGQNSGSGGGDQGGSGGGGGNSGSEGGSSGSSAGS